MLLYCCMRYEIKTISIDSSEPFIIQFLGAFDSFIKKLFNSIEGLSRFMKLIIKKEDKKIFNYQKS